MVEKITENLDHQGFGVTTIINVHNTFKIKLNVGFRNYKILSACNPLFAYKAISLESHMGVMLPCNIVIQEHENAYVQCSAFNPIENLDKDLYTTQLVNLATEIGVRLRAAVDFVHHRPPKVRRDALPV